MPVSFDDSIMVTIVASVRHAKVSGSTLQKWTGKNRVSVTDRYLAYHLENIFRNAGIAVA